ncbi:OmpA family protein [Hyphomicrobiales bacterium]|nr:OmpA family protein [Hyphomicrobiales bacterium]CAH1697956.1 OmpA family protein [Hyphomicrobiales bacterium]CAI0347603.1 OmpA family protein [Hyphomicrobiales bacterium]
MRTKRWLLVGTVLPALVLSQAGQAFAEAGYRLAQAPAPGDDQPGQRHRQRPPGAQPGQQRGPERPMPPGMPQAPRPPQMQPGPAAPRPQPPAMPAPQPRAEPPAARPQPERPPMPREMPQAPRPAPNMVPAPGQPPAARPTPPRPPSEPAMPVPPRAAPQPPAPPAATPGPQPGLRPSTPPSAPPQPGSAPSVVPRGGPAVPPSAAPTQPRPPAVPPSVAPGVPVQPGTGAPPSAVPRGGPAVPPSAAPAQPGIGTPPSAVPRGGPAVPPSAAPQQPRLPGAAPQPATPPAAAPAPAQPGAIAPMPPAGAAPTQPPRPAPAAPAQPGIAAPPPPAGAAPAQPGIAPVPGQPPAGGAFPSQPPQREGRRGGVSPGVAGAIGLGAGVLGGIMATQGAQRFDDIRSRREERREGDYTIIREPGRTIIRDDDGRAIIRRDEDQRFRDLGWQGRSERRDGEMRTVFERPDGTRVVTVTDEEGRLIRRTRIDRDNREVIIIDNTLRDRPGRFADDIVVLPPPPLPIPRERYIVDADQADEALIYETITAPPIAAIPRRYTLDEVRYSPDLRARMRSVDIDTITFDTGSWQVTPDQAQRLAVIADSVRRALQSSPNEVFLVEGHTDAVGADVDNLSLSDRRAQSVAEILTRDFQIPPENLTTQGYGEQYLKVQTQDASRQNRRVTLRRITPLLTGQNR